MPVYRNLVFKGGGVRGVAYIGALKYLYENGLMRSVERAAGTSAGAITALILSFNFENYDSIKAISDSLDYRKIPAEGDLKPEQAKLMKANSLAVRSQSLGIVKNLQCSLRLLQEKGWYSSDYFYGWLRSSIDAQFSAKKETYTFRDFRNSSIHRGGRDFFDLHITGTDISNRRSRVFSFDTTPDMEVAMAVRISMSIPLFFEAVPFRYPGTDDSQYFADGGVMWNYPISIFDDPKFGKKFSKGMNEETLGFFLYTSPESTEYKEVKGMMDYIGALFESLLLVQEQLVLYGEKNRERTIFINDQGVPSTNFNISKGDAVYEKLFYSGYLSTKEFFAEKTNWDMMLHKLKTRFGWKGTEY
ncbi:MAG: patatin-like phospholipase family protein [Candidatus Hydrogenedentales bacterium]